MGALTELVTKARRGSAESKQELDEHLRPLVHGVLLAWLPHALAGPQVRGLISDAFGAILSEDARFVPTLLARVRTAAQNLARQRPDAADPVPADPALREALAILARLRKLPERERERLALRLIEGIPGPEISEALQANEREVAAELEKGLALLQEGPGAQVVQLKDDPWLWNLSGRPHPVVVRLENLLTPLRYDDAAAPEELPATHPVGVQAAPPRKSSANVPAAPAAAPTAIGVDPRRNSGANLKAAPPAEPTDPPTQALLFGDDDETGERTEAALEDPRRKNPFAQQPSTIAAQDLPAAAQVNPYAGMPSTVAANDLPAAARVGGEGGPVPQVAAKRPTGAGAPRASNPGAVPQPAAGVRPTAEAPPSKPSISLADDDANDTTGMQPPGALQRAPKAVGEQPTGMMQSLGGAGESPTRVQPVAAPVAWRSVLFAEDDDEASITLPVPERNRLLRKKGVWRGRAPFILAGMMGTLAIAVAWVAVSSSQRRATRMWNLVPVTVAATDLSEGTVVTEDKISTRAVPEHFVTASVVKPDGYSYVVGQKLLVPVQAGDPLLWSHFEMAQATERLARRVLKRARAMSIVTDRATSVGGWVRPGDWVDVIVSLRDGPKSGTRSAVTLVQDVPVIATGKISEKTNYGILSPSQREYVHVSLLVLPEEAEMLFLAQEVGKFKLTLRSEGDHETNRDGYGSNAKTLLDGERVRLLQKRRLATIRIIRDTAVVPAAVPRPDRLRIEPRQ